jgi:dTDP-4-dehydrorhamnose reductase
MRVIVTGAAGQLGQAMTRHFSHGHTVLPLGRSELDVTIHEDVMRAVAGFGPDAIVNCAAYNAVDAAERDVPAALQCNAMAVRSLARAAAAVGATLVHYGTDFVFDGEASTPYTEEDDPAPKSVYGQSKLLGEWFAADAGRYYVLRVESLFGGPLPRSSIDRIVSAVEEGRPARVFIDRIVSPTYTEDVAGATAALLAGEAPHGVYHCVNTGHASWHEVGLEVARLLGREPLFDAVQAKDVPLAAPRPRFCALSNARLLACGVAMPSWQDALARYLSQRRTPTAA